MRTLRIPVLAAIFLAAFSVAAPPKPQSWEKEDSSGLVYRMEIDPALPRVLHAIKIPAGIKGFRAVPALGQGVVFADDKSVGREFVSKIVARYGGVAGINADFFPWTGDPLGAMVVNGELVSLPKEGWTVFGWGPGSCSLANLTGTLSLKVGDATVPIDGLNEECGDGMLVLSTPISGKTYAKLPALHAVVEVSGPLLPSGKLSGTVRYLIPDTPSVPVPPGQVILTAIGKPAATLLKMHQGDKLTIESKTLGFDWARYNNALSGGQWLVRDGKANKDWSRGGFKKDFVETRHPRSAIGKTKSGDIWIVAVDGRQTMSVGASLPELSTVMLSLGCTDALNLDGGGSTALVFHGMVMNKPSGGVEREVANAFVLVPTAPLPAPDGSPRVIQGPPTLTEGSEARYRVIGPDGVPVPSPKVLWAASGQGWVDQLGFLRTLKPGKVKLQAWVGDSLISIDVIVESKEPVKPGQPRSFECY